MPRVAKSPVKESTIPDTIRSYQFHDVNLNYRKGVSEAIADCPFCGREGKFSVNVKTGQWRCFVCGGNQSKGGGGLSAFMELLVKLGEEITTDKDYASFAESRGLENPQTLKQWGVCRSPTNGNWMIPGWGMDKSGKRKMLQLYVYIYFHVKDIMKLLPTPGLKKGNGPRQTLFGLNTYSAKRNDVFVCEGPWDGMRLWECMQNGQQSLPRGNVLAVPGCSSFSEEWSRWFKNKNTHLLYDNDHPKESSNGLTQGPAGTNGMKRVAGILEGVADNLTYLNWGQQGYDHDLPDGYDVRDILSESDGLDEIANRLTRVPDNWGDEELEEITGLECRPCQTWDALTESWKIALEWIDGLDRALSVMLASIASTQSLGDQLWIKVIGPASCGKSTLCEALSVNKTYILAKSIIRGFHSGYTLDKKSDSEDNSLLAQLNGKTLITKDGDTLLQTPNKSQILSEARDIYDGSSRTHYRNRNSKDYEGFRTTWILCGTSSLRAIDSSELGERFLDCVIMEEIDIVTEADILERKAEQAINHVDHMSNGKPTEQNPKDMTACMELTGGYINWLKENAAKVLPTIEFGRYAKHQCINFGKFVAFMRARPSTMQQEKAEREMAARLVSQHVRLAKCLALVLNQKSVNGLVLARVRLVCLDTARGLTLEIVKQIFPTGLKGMEVRAIAFKVNGNESTIRNLVKFLTEIKVLERVPSNKKVAWRVTEEMDRLYSKVVLKRK